MNPGASQSTASGWVPQISTIHATKSRVKIWKADVGLNVAMWADEILMWLKSAKEHSFISTQEVSTDSTLTKKYTCMSELVHSRVISCEKVCWTTLLDILLTSSCRHMPCTWTYRFTRLQILNAIWVLWRSFFGGKSCAKLAVKSELKRCHMDVIRVFYIRWSLIHTLQWPVCVETEEKRINSLEFQLQFSF